MQASSFWYVLLLASDIRSWAWEGLRYKCKDGGCSAWPPILRAAAISRIRDVYDEGVKRQARSVKRRIVPIPSLVLLLLAQVGLVVEEGLSGCVMLIALLQAVIAEGNPGSFIASTRREDLWLDVVIDGH